METEITTTYKWQEMSNYTSSIKQNLKTFIPVLPNTIETNNKGRYLHIVSVIIISNRCLIEIV